MRNHLIILTALAGLVLGAPAHAQTAINCTTAAQALSFSAHAGKILDLRVTYDEKTVVDGIVRSALGAAYIGYADSVQIYDIDPGKHMLVASAQGCHVAHVFVGDSTLAKVSAYAARAGAAHTT